MNFDEIAFNAVEEWRARSYINRSQETAAVQVLIKKAMCLAIDEAVKVANERTSDYHSQVQNTSENRAAIRIIEAIKELKE